MLFASDSGRKGYATEALYGRRHPGPARGSVALAPLYLLSALAVTDTFELPKHEGDFYSVEFDDGAMVFDVPFAPGLSWRFDPPGERDDARSTRSLTSPGASSLARAACGARRAQRVTPGVPRPWRPAREARGAYPPVRPSSSATSASAR